MIITTIKMAPPPPAAIPIIALVDRIGSGPQHSTSVEFIPVVVPVVAPVAPVVAPVAPVVAPVAPVVAPVAPVAPVVAPVAPVVAPVAPVVAPVAEPDAEPVVASTVVAPVELVTVGTIVVHVVPENPALQEQVPFPLIPSIQVPLLQLGQISQLGP